MKKTRAGETLREVADLVDGPRNKAHGEKVASFEGIARIWNAYLINGGLTKKPMMASDVSQMMALLKMTRPQFGERDIDHYRDQCGYSGITAELIMHEDGYEMVDDGTEFEHMTETVGPHVKGETK